MRNERKKLLNDLLIYTGAITFISALFVLLAGVTPAGPKKITYNFTFMYLSLGCNIIFWLSGIIQRFSNKKTWWSWVALYLFSVLLFPSLFGFSLLNFIYAGFPDWRVITPLGAMYIFAAMMPFINEKLSETLHTEIFAPRSRLGRILQISILSLAPITGVFGAFLSGAAERSGGVMGYSIMGLAFHFFFVWVTISMAYQAWERRPWKIGDKE